MYVTAKFTNGLCNQFFQLAAVFGYAERSGHHTVVFVEGFYENFHHDEKNTLLQYFPEIPVIKLEGEWKVLKEGAGNAFTYIELPNFEANIILEGAFISYKYFPSYAIKSKYFDSLKIPNLPYESCAFLHIRRGDYLLLPHHNVNLEKYMAYGLSSFAEDTKIIVCSNDVAWCKENLSKMYKTIVKDEQWIILDETVGNAETLKIMGACGRGGICANSTFSWWGGYMNTKKYPVYMPSVWGHPPYFPPIRNLFPDWATVLPIE